MRDKTLQSLTRRFDEVISLTNGNFNTSERYYQFLYNITHYMRYVDENHLTNSAIKRLKEDKRRKKLDKQLVNQADLIIERMRVDRDKIAALARRRGIVATAPDTGGVARRLTDEEVIGLHIAAVNNYLEGNDQYVGDLSRNIGELRQAAFYLSQSMTRPPQWLQDIRTSYNDDQNDVSRKVESFKILSDYLRLHDYRELEKISNYVNDKADHQEALMFLLVNDDLIDKSNTRHFNATDVQHAKKMSDEYVGHLQRVHNYLIDELENPRWYERMWMWLKEHLLPTFISLVIVFAVYAIARFVFHIPLEPQAIKDLIG
jgi:hypothetical protein